MEGDPPPVIKWFRHISSINMHKPWFAKLYIEPHVLYILAKTCLKRRAFCTHIDVDVTPQERAPWLHKPWFAKSYIGPHLWVFWPKSGRLRLVVRAYVKIYRRWYGFADRQTQGFMPCLDHKSQARYSENQYSRIFRILNKSKKCLVLLCC